jgi:hypothetical protein
MHIDNRYYIDPITNEVVFINPAGGNIQKTGIKAVAVTNQLGAEAFESAFATDAAGIERAFKTIQVNFPGCPLAIIDSNTARNIRYRNVGGLNFNLSTSALWITMNDLAIVHPLAVLIRVFEQAQWGKPFRLQMRDALEQNGIINEVLG